MAQVFNSSYYVLINTYYYKAICKGLGKHWKREELDLLCGD